MKLIVAGLVATFFQAVSGVCPFMGTRELTEMTEQELVNCPHALKASPDFVQLTRMGCTCKSNCGATLGDNYNCGWCYTEGGCGRRGVSGKYDYCDYSANVTAEHGTWDKKSDSLWAQITDEPTSSTYPSVLGILTESIQTSFDKYGDVMPHGRSKKIHAVGAVCKFNMVVSQSSPFTGLFKPGSVVHGVMRLGSALSVSKKSGIIPGVGFKMLRSNMPSANFVALNSLNPLPDNNYDFFAMPISNHIAPPDSTITSFLAKKFNQASTCATKVGLSDACKYDIDGVKVQGTPVFPYKLVMNSLLHIPDSPVDQATLQQNIINGIAAHPEVYQVDAYTSPQNKINLGTMVVEGACTNSKFGDENMMFRHQLIEEDWNLNDAYFQITDGKAECGTSISKDPPRQCNED